MAKDKRLLVVQFAGDYLEAYHRLQDSGSEAYYGHAYVLDQLARIGQTFGEAGVLCCRAGRIYRETLPSGVVVMGLDRNPDLHSAAVNRAIADFDPTHLVIAGPMPALIRQGIAAHRRMACLFADSFNTSALRRLLRYGRIDRLLNRPEIEWVANHGINACRSLVRVGVSSEKVLPWDWPHHDHPNTKPAKDLPQNAIPTLAFVGSLHPSKGIGDVIDAVALLKARALPVQLRVAGGGQVDRFRQQAQRRGVAELIEFLGLIPNRSVMEMMQAASIVVIPSRHRFPEGLPLTIYEALRSRTPIIASDHPMFAGHLVHDQTALVYPAGNTAALADRIADLLSDPTGYRRLSDAAPGTWDRIQIPLKWGDLLFRWMQDGAADQAWLKGQMLSRRDAR